MEIIFNCKECDQELSVDAEAAGSEFNCPTCGTQLVVPQADGAFRKFDLTIWSEDWPRLFETMDALRAYVADNNIRTPEGHKYDPNRKAAWRKKK